MEGLATTLTLALAAPGDNRLRIQSESTNSWSRSRISFQSSPHVSVCCQNSSELNQQKWCHEARNQQVSLKLKSIGMSLRYRKRFLDKPFEENRTFWIFEKLGCFFVKHNHIPMHSDAARSCSGQQMLRASTSLRSWDLSIAELHGESGFEKLHRSLKRLDCSRSNVNETGCQRFSNTVSDVFWSQLLGIRSCLWIQRQPWSKIALPNLLPNRLVGWESSHSTCIDCTGVLESEKTAKGPCTVWRILCTGSAQTCLNHFKHFEPLGRLMMEQNQCSSGVEQLDAAEIVALGVTMGLQV